MGITNSTQPITQLIAEWAASDGSAKAVWQAWRDGMMMQDRPVPIEHQAWVAVQVRDKRLDAMIAAQVARAIISYIEERQNAAQ